MRPILYLCAAAVISTSSFAEPVPPYELEEVRMLCEEWAEAEEVTSAEHAEFLTNCIKQELEARGYYNEQSQEDDTESYDEMSDETYSEDSEPVDPEPQEYQ
jgi:hypothetical protein